MDEPDPTEVYLVSGEPRQACIVCSPSAERLVDSLTEGTFTLCAAHLLRAHVYGNDRDGSETLRPVPG